MNRKTQLFSAIFSAVSLSAVAVMPSLTYADIIETEQKPLMVIRFNQARVYYDQQLYTAISQAVAIKPQVTFEVISNAPVTGNEQVDAQWVATASRNTQKVVASLRAIGVPMERMHVTGQAQPGLRYDETQIFVR